MHTAATATRAGEEGRPLSWAPSAHAVAGEGGMILDLHIHTSWNSADSNLSPIELIREAKRLGLDGVVVTEHDRGWDRFRARELAAEHDFLFLRSMEVSTDLEHILICSLKEYVSNIQRAEKLQQ